MAPKTERSLCCCRVCTFISLTLGVLFLLIGIWFTHLYQRFTPVYTTMTCKVEPLQWKGFSPGFPANLGLEFLTTTTCDNPNPYSVKMKSTKAGGVYLGADRTPAGTITEIPETELKAKESGSIRAHLTVKPTGKLLSTLLQAVTLGIFRPVTLPVWTENNMEVDINIKFLLGNVTTTKSFDKDCGMNIKLAGFAEPVMGPFACAEDFAELSLPPVDGTAPPGDLQMKAINLAEDQIQEGTRLKNISLGVGMGVGYGLGLILLCVGLLGLYQLCFQRKVVADEGNSTNVASARVIGARPHLEV